MRGSEWVNVLDSPLPSLIPLVIKPNEYSVQPFNQNVLTIKINTRKWRRVANLLFSNRTPWFVRLLSESEGGNGRFPPKDMSYIKNINKMK